MKLNINSPMYYTMQFGVIDEIHKMCQDIQNVVKEKSYSPVIDIVGITPIFERDIVQYGKTVGIFSD